MAEVTREPSDPEVSVVMSVFNGAQYLRESIESILQQRNVSLELIVVNDGSSDNSAEILMEIATADPRVVIVDQENAGLTAALIRGCQMAKGEFIARQDADDISLPGRLRQQRDALQQDVSLVFVSSSAQGVGPNGEKLEVIRRPIDPEVATHQLLFEKTGPPAHGTVMMRRAAYEAVGGYRAEFYFAQDSDLWLRLGRIGKLKYLPAILYAWRVSPGGISSMRQTLQWRFGDIGQACHAAILRDEPEQTLLCEAADLALKIRSEKHQPLTPNGKTEAWGLYRIGTTLARQGDKRARGYFWQTIQAQPLHFRAWIRLFRTFVSSAKATSRSEHLG